jgi:hypothetical protein
MPRPSEDEFHAQLRAEGVETTTTEVRPTWGEMLRALGFNSVEEAEEYARHLGGDAPAVGQLPADDE